MLELPKREGPAERGFNIKRRASCIIAVKNPETPTPPTAGLDPEQEARLPKNLQAKFAGRKFLPVNPPDFLDYAGAELVLIGAEENVEKELHIEFTPDEENEHTADVFKDLKLPRDVVRVRLFGN